MLAKNVKRGDMFTGKTVTTRHTFFDGNHMRVCIWFADGTCGSFCMNDRG